MNLQFLGDRIAIGLSMACVLHCLLLPIVLLLVPPLSGVIAFDDEAFHLWLLYAVVPISVIALLVGVTKHRNHRVVVSGVIGLSLLGIAVVAGHNLLGEFGEVLLTVVGSLFVAYGHMRNFQLRNQQCHQPKESIKP